MLHLVAEKYFWVTSCTRKVHCKTLLLCPRKHVYSVRAHIVIASFLLHISSPLILSLSLCLCCIPSIIPLTFFACQALLYQSAAHLCSKAQSGLSAGSLMHPSHVVTRKWISPLWLIPDVNFNSAPLQQGGGQSGNSM